MNFLRKLIDKQRKLYHEPNSKLHKVWPAFEAFETFLMSPDHVAPKKGPHVRDYVDLKRVMWVVVVALLPCFLWSVWNTGDLHFAAVAAMLGKAAASGESFTYAVGWLQGILCGGDYAAEVASTEFAAGLFDKVVFGLDQILPILVVSYAVGLGIEMLFSIVRKEEVSEGYLVSGILIALIVPPSIPLWQLTLAIAFSVILVKEVFGGTGMNIFNVALMARAFLFFGYPAQISGEFVWVAGNGPSHLIDGFSQATPLAVAANAKIQAAHDTGGFTEATNNGVTYLVDSDGFKYFQDAGEAVREVGYSGWDMFIGAIPGSLGETSALMILIGAAILLVTGIASWRTMASGCIGLVFTAGLMSLFAGGMDGIGSLPLLDHFVMGGFLFGIVFMATDPVTCPETNVGKWIYGFLIGAIAVLVRAVNPAYPEGMMLAILLLNAFAPTIDHFVVAANIRRRKARLG